MEPQSNVRPIAILVTYLSVAFSIAGLIIRSLLLRLYKRRDEKSVRSHWRRNACLFAALSFVSLGITWYHMLAYFQWSYLDWESTHAKNAAASSSALRLGEWLKDTSLFRQAWGTAAETAERFWWTQQIFFITALWSVYLGVEGQRRQIPHCWAFMLLGQIVAISFALNLCFTAVILFAPATRDLRDVHTQVDKADSEDRSGSTMSSTNTSTPSLLWYFPIFAVTFYAVYSVPYIVGQESFLQYLTIPHILLFFPAIYHNIMPRTWRKTHSSWAAGERYVLVVYQTICAVSFALHARTTLALFHDETTIFDTARNVIRALWEHPAVSSVGWDVILCFSSATIWRILQPASLERS